MTKRPADQSKLLFPVSGEHAAESHVNAPPNRERFSGIRGHEGVQLRLRLVPEHSSTGSRALPHQQCTGSSSSGKTCSDERACKEPRGREKATQNGSSAFSADRGRPFWGLDQWRGAPGAAQACPAFWSSCPWGPARRPRQDPAWCSLGGSHPPRCHPSSPAQNPKQLGSPVLQSEKCGVSTLISHSNVMGTGPA